MVDNDSKKDEASVISAKYPQVIVIRSPQNLGFAGGNNLGIKAARGKYLFFINNDTIFKEVNIQVIPHSQRSQSETKPLVLVKKTVVNTIQPTLPLMRMVLPCSLNERLLIKWD